MSNNETQTENPVSAGFTDLVIESGVPMPPTRRTGLGARLREEILKMNPGDSVRRDSYEDCNRIRTVATRLGLRVMVRQEPSGRGYRLWMVGPAGAPDAAPEPPPIDGAPPGQ